METGNHATTSSSTFSVSEEQLFGRFYFSRSEVYKTEPERRKV
jgi:hypothetical protein